MDNVNKAIRNWKVHALALMLCLVAHGIGIRSFRLGPATVVLLPLFYSFVLGAVISAPKFRVLSKDEMSQVSSIVGVVFFLLMAKYGSFVGPNIMKIAHTAPALVLQEFGNVATALVGVPLAVWLGLRREAVGAAFSIAREGSIAIIGEKYGMASPEGFGVMGVYITGTVFGALFCSFMSSFIASTVSWFSPQALAMACGTGSAGMMTASLAPLVEMFPDLKEELMALAASSDMLTSIDGIYMMSFIALPMAEFLARACGVKEAPGRPAE